MVIDFHTHIFSPRMKEQRGELCRIDPNFAALYSSPRARMATAEELVESMEKAEVARSVVVGFCWRDFSMCLEHNSYILESIVRFPEKLIGFGVVPVEAPEKIDDEIERCASGGMKGIGELRPDLPAYDFTDEKRSWPFAELLMEKKLVLLTHASEPVGHTYDGKGVVTPEKLYPFIFAHPGLTIVCAHWGGGLPFYGLMPEVKKALANVYFDTAASPFLYSPGIYRQVGMIIGADRILFGTDYPLMAQARVIKEIRSSMLDEEANRLILGGNAERLLGIKENSITGGGAGGIP